MVREIQPRQQTVGEIGISGGTNTVFQQKASNLAGLNQVVQEVTDPIAEGILSAEAEGKRLAKYEAEKDLPIELIPKEEGGFNPFSLTKWGRMYDKSYNEIDKQLVGYKAQEALTENALNLSRPENQGPGITARYAAESDKIIKAYVDSASPANRNELMMSLTAKAREKEFGIAETEANYNRVQIKSQLEQTTKKLDADLLEAGFHKDDARIAELSSELISNVNSQQNLNLLTAAEADAMKLDISSRAKQAYITGQYIQAKSEGNEDAFIRDVAENPDRYSLTMGEAEGVVTNILKVNALEDKAANEFYTMQGLQFEADYYTGESTTHADLAKYELNDKQVLKYSAFISKENAKTGKKQRNYNQAIKEISANQGAGVDKALIDGLQDNAVLATQNEIGRVLTLPEQYSVLRGEGPFPASTIPGLSLGTNVPSFDRRVSGALTSEDPGAMIQGALVYQASVSSGNPNTLNLTGQALQSAVMMTSLMNGNVDPIQAAQKVTTAVLKQDEAGTALRLKEFNSTDIQDTLPNAFKKATGASSDKNQFVYGDYVNQARVNFAAGLDIDDAIEATSHNFKNITKSEYFVPGAVGPLAPESLPQIGYEIKNQMALSVQNLINNGASGKGGLPVEWANPKDAIDLKTINTDELVSTPLSAVSNGEAGLYPIGDPVYNTKLPKIKVGNVVSNVYLMPGARVRYGDNGRPIYQLGYVDDIGALQPITDRRGPNQQATFSPVSADQFAPNYFASDSAKKRVALIKEASREKATREKIDRFGLNYAKRMFEPGGLSNNFDLEAAENEQKIAEGLNKAGL